MNLLFNTLLHEAIVSNYELRLNNELKNLLLIPGVYYNVYLLDDEGKNEVIWYVVTKKILNKEINNNLNIKKLLNILDVLMKNKCKINIDRHGINDYKANLVNLVLEELKTKYSSYKIKKYILS